MSKVLTLNVQCRGSKCICPDNNKPQSLKVETVTRINNVTSFTKYSHSIPNRTFTLNKRLKNGDIIETAIRSRETSIPSVQSVSVYYWNGNLGKPILIEVKDGSSGTKYYCHSSTTGRGRSNWSNVGNENSRLVQLLDEQNCARNHAVPLEISDPTKNHAPDIKSTCLNEFRKITGPISPKLTIPGGDYTVQEYKVHTPSALENGTKISRVVFGGNDTNISLPKRYPVYRVRIYSQQGTKDSNPPLMLQFIKDGTDSEWFYSRKKDGIDWGEVHDTYGFYSDSAGTEPQEALTTELDNVRCFRENLVTMNISESVSAGQSYCCKYHKGNSAKVTVSESFASVGSYASIPFHKHEISDANTKLAKIKFSPHSYTQDTTRKYIKFTGLTPYITGPVSVYVFYCGGNEPVLICVEYSGGQGNVTGWYQKDKSSDDDSKWIIVSNGLDKSPDNIQNCNEWTKLRDALQNASGCSQYKTCKEPTQPSSPVFGAGGPARPTGPKESPMIAISIESPPKGDLQGFYTASVPTISLEPPTISTGARGSISGSSTIVGEFPDVPITSGNSPEYPADFQGGGAHTEGTLPGVGSGLGSASTVPEESPTTQVQRNEHSLQSDPAPTTQSPSPAAGAPARSTGGLLEVPFVATIGYFFATSAGSGLTGFLGYKGYKLYQNFKGDPWVRQI
ncbi:hypothetical protein BEWA_040290 [Theileria equi strain WA]|uniref:Uncharacterized protein n=1 Tax=Theileria equi strain WA TaxID=1537102 RepID=L1LF60_THEEQ|nr:hypothetical protein BEWA_040290 [Theileria equi strain WA]EKX73991.1 hypothetical protein BEWA_040290 [Theileria equi strain WA]|eukprot:XP_004833443.1 hypothetical protein BEWA_040290 [Theileria equi strain WA]